LYGNLLIPRAIDVDVVCLRFGEPFRHFGRFLIIPTYVDWSIVPVLEVVEELVPSTGPED
jgi:hypothetical protein